MRAPPPEVLAAAHLITKWAAENNIRDFAIDGIQQHVRPQRAVYGCGGDPIDDDIADNWCTDYHCPGDCGLRGHGYQHQGHGGEDDPEQQEWVISGLSNANDEPKL